MDRHVAEKIHAEIIAALDAVAKKHGVQRIKSRMSYGKDGFKITDEFQLAGGRSKMEIAYERYSRLLGLPPLGTKFVSQGANYETTGLLVGGPYKSLVYKCTDTGKQFKFDVFRMQKLIAALNTSGVRRTV